MSPENDNKSPDFRIQSPLDIHLIHHWAIIHETSLSDTINLMGQEYLEAPMEDGVCDYSDGQITTPVSPHTDDPLPEIVRRTHIVLREDGTLGSEEFEDFTDRSTDAIAGDTSGFMGMVFRLRPDISIRLLGQAVAEGKTEPDLLSKLVRVYHLRRTEGLD